MREHAPHSTRLAGVVTTTAITLAMGYVLAHGIGSYIANAPPEPMMFTPLPDVTPVEPPPTTSTNLDTSSDSTLDIVTPLSDIPRWEIEPPVTGSTDLAPPRADPGPPAPFTPAPPKSVRMTPQIIPADPPPYPPTSVRRGDQGNTGLAVCLDARGRVTAASLAASSGHDTLDQAALRWVRNLKFTPLRIDGVPQPICNHAVTYEWRLDRR